MSGKDMNELKARLEGLEVEQQLRIAGQALSLHGQLNRKVVPVHALALAFIVPQGVTCGKIVAYGQPPESAFCHDSIQ